MKAPIDVLILSASFGGGHRAVSEALREELQDYQIRAHMVDPYEELNPKLNKINADFYIKLMKYAPSLYGLFYDLTYDLSMNNIFNKLGAYIGREKLLEILENYKPKVIVATYPTYAGMLSHLKKENRIRSHVITVITDFVAHSQWIHQHIDTYFVASQEVFLNLIKKGIPPEKIYISGIPIRKSFSEDYPIEALREKYGVKEGLPVILLMNIAFGNLRALKEVCDVLMDIDIPFKSFVLCGRDEKLCKAISNYDKRFVPLRGFLNMAELMSIAYLLISKAGGITTSESLAKGLPMVFYKVPPGQEKHNADYVSKHGAGLIANRSYEFKNFLKALLTNKELYELVKEKTKEIAKPFASKYVARYINDVLQKL
ncbi:MAG: MGDG synthase family glycosyltransferase [Aquificaceae bacterium]